MIRGVASTIIRLLTPASLFIMLYYISLCSGKLVQSIMSFHAVLLYSIPFYHSFYTIHIASVTIAQYSWVGLQPRPLSGLTRESCIQVLWFLEQHMNASIPHGHLNRALPVCLASSLADYVLQTMRLQMFRGSDQDI